MAIGYSLFYTVIDTGTIILAGVNIMVLAMLVRLATLKYVDQTDIEVKLRLQAIWMLAFVVLTASVLKLVLPQELANQIIAAWFVGQGFALQPYVQSFLTGFAVRSDETILARLKDSRTKVIFQSEEYTIQTQNLDTLSLKLERNDGDKRKIVKRVPWTKVDDMEFM